ncbi:MAG: DsbA family protein, partial [Bauldia sp.]
DAVIGEAASETAPMTPMPAAGIDVAQLNDSERAEIEGMIRNYLLANPEIIRDAINELQRKEDEAEQIAATKAIADNAEAIFSSPIDVVLGNPDGDVTLVEFFDYNCTYCRRAHADMKQLIETDPKLRIVLKEFPILGDGSVAAARVALAVLVTAPEKYAAFQNALISEKGQADGERAMAVAEELGLDVQALSAARDGPEVTKAINETYELAAKLNLTGTPSYVTEREVVVGAVGYDALKAKIGDVRACATAAC